MLYEGAPNMSKELSRNEWSVLLLHDDFLELRWLPSTAGLDAASFMATLSWFAGETERARPRAVLSDVLALHFTPDAALLSWREAEIIPRYAAAGVERFAFLVPPDDPRAHQQLFEGAAPYPTRWFVDRGAALGWLRTPRTS